MTEIAVISSGSAEPGLDFVAAAFEKETGHKVSILYNQGAGAKKRLQDGDFDVLIATSSALKRLFDATGLIEEGGIKIGRAGIGVTVRPGAPLPDISSVESLKRALLEADSIVITSETSGIYIAEMLQKMGIYDQVKAKLDNTPPTAPATAARIMAGRGREIGFLPFNAIRSHAKVGLVLVGPLPEEVQWYRNFVAVPAVKSTHKEVAREFVRFCAGPGKPLFVANGLL